MATIAYRMTSSATALLFLFLSCFIAQIPNAMFTGKTQRGGTGWLGGRIDMVMKAFS